MTVPLTPAEHAHFQREGLLVIPNQFSGEELDALRDDFQRLRRRADGLTATEERDGALFVVTPTSMAERPGVHRVVWCGAAEPGLAATGEDPRILGRAAQLLGASTVDQLVNQAHFKEPGDGVEFPLHQDAWNRRYGTDLWLDSGTDGSYVQVLLTIDRMTEANGPLLYVPGSHHRGPIMGDDRQARIDELARSIPPRAVVAEPGTLVFFGPFLVHGSTPNHSDRSRRVLINGFARRGVNRRVYHGAGRGVRRTVSPPNEHSPLRSVGPEQVHPLGT